MPLLLGGLARRRGRHGRGIGGGRLGLNVVERGHGSGSVRLAVVLGGSRGLGDHGCLVGGLGDRRGVRGDDRSLGGGPGDRRGVRGDDRSLVRRGDDLGLPASSASTGHPHVVQNFAPGLSSLPQFVQNMGTSPSLCLGNMIRARPKLAVAQHTNKRPDHASRDRVKMCPKIFDTNGAPGVAPMGCARTPTPRSRCASCRPRRQCLRSRTGPRSASPS